VLREAWGIPMPRYIIAEFYNLFLFLVILVVPLSAHDPPPRHSQEEPRRQHDKINDRLLRKYDKDKDGRGSKRGRSFFRLLPYYFSFSTYPTATSIYNQNKSICVLGVHLRLQE
jgi:hypothetical protein